MDTTDDTSGTDNADGTCCEGVDGCLELWTGDVAEPPVDRDETRSPEEGDLGEEDQREEKQGDESPSFWQRRVRLPVVFAVVAVVAVVGAFRVPSGYGTFETGPTPRVEMTDAANDIGNWHFTTVKVTPTSIAGYMWDKLRGAETIDVAEPGSQRDVTAASTSMRMSQETAWAVARDLAQGGDGQADLTAAVTAVASDSPAAQSGVAVGDSIVAIDGAEISAPEDVVSAVSESEGSPLTLSVVAADGTRRDVTATPEQTDGTWRLGVTLQPRPRHDDGSRPPIDSQHVGGPSGGLIFTLAYLDALDEGDLTGGRTVAGTGTIGADGDVGAVDGVHLKVQGAIGESAKVFFVPAENYAEAVAAATGRIEVVKVDTVGDAVDWLCSHGAESGVCR